MADTELWFEIDDDGTLWKCTGRPGGRATWCRAMTIAEIGQQHPDYLVSIENELAMMGREAREADARPEPSRRSGRLDRARDKGSSRERPPTS